MSDEEDRFARFAHQLGVFQDRSTRESSPGLGATMWDFFLRMDEQLRDLTQRIRSTEGETRFNDYVRRHIETVSYLKVLEENDLIPQSDRAVEDIQEFARLEGRYQKSKGLQGQIDLEDQRYRALRRWRDRAATYIADYKAALMDDPDLNPSEVERRLESRVLIEEAHAEFIDHFPANERLEDATPSEVKALVAGPKDRIDGVGAMVKRYMIGAFYLAAADELLTDIDSRLSSLRTENNEVRIASEQEEELDLFKRGAHPEYNAGIYFQAFNRVLMQNVMRFLKGAGLSPPSD